MFAFFAYVWVHIVWIKNSECDKYDDKIFTNFDYIFNFFELEEAQGMNYSDILLLIVFVIVTILYSCFYHEKSPIFIVSVLWFVLNILIAIGSICLKYNIVEIENQQMLAYFSVFTEFMNELKNISIILFSGIIILFSFSKNKKQLKENV